MAMLAKGTVRVEISNDYVARRTAAALPWLRWSDIAAVPVAATAMLSLTLGLAAEPWAPGCSPAAAYPFFGAALVFLMAADLLFAPRQQWSRSRNNAAMNTTGAGTLVVLLMCPLAAGWFAWPAFFPLLLFPLSLIVPPVIGFGLFHRVKLSPSAHGVAIGACLTVGAALMIVGHHGLQMQAACRWTGI
jgi:hypothetical protein